MAFTVLATTRTSFLGAHDQYCMLCLHVVFYHFKQDVPLFKTHYFPFRKEWLLLAQALDWHFKESLPLQNPLVPAKL